MNLFLSLKEFFIILKEDVTLASRGSRLGSLVMCHYIGRLQSKYKLDSTFFSFKLKLLKRNISLELTAQHLGAFRGVFVDNEYFLRELKEFNPKRILDLGANIGMGTIYLSSQFPEASFICIEPDKRNLSLLEKNLKRNNLNAIIIPKAIAEYNGSAKLRFNDNPCVSRFASLPEQDLLELTHVEVLTVGDILDGAGWDRVNLVKIDIEGAEEDILSKNNNWLNRVDFLVMEIHPNTSSKKIQTYLEPYGFTLARIGAGREPIFFAKRN
jgi:FkbM family methyltransferase